jgi:hypothetical protein
MSDDADVSAETDDTTEESPADPEAASANADEGDDPDVDVSTVVRYLQWGGLLGLGLLAVVATVGLYTSLSSIIDIWVGRQYEPLARAGFNLAVLCVTLAGLLGLLRRL